MRRINKDKYSTVDNSVLGTGWWNGSMTRLRFVFRKTFAKTIFFTLLKYLPPRPVTNYSISSGFDEGPPPEKWNVLWLVSCPSALWLVNSLDGVSVLPHPLQKQQVCQYCHINADLQNIEQEDRADPLHARILQDIKVVMLLLFLAKSHFRWMSTTA